MSLCKVVKHYNRYVFRSPCVLNIFFCFQVAINATASWGFMAMDANTPSTSVFLIRAEMEEAAPVG